MNAFCIKRLLQIIEQQLDWEDSSSWQSRDFEILNELIFEKTKVSLSATTLKRIWGRVEYNHSPSDTTLDALAKFAGYENWRAFARQKVGYDEVSAISAAKNISATDGASIRKKGGVVKIVLLLVAVMIIAFFSIQSKNNGPKNSRKDYTFSIRPITRGIPNSVIFKYATEVGPNDSVFIQQSWDPQTRVAVDKNRHDFTSVYYQPGFFHAKLIVDGKVVKEHPLMIPTDGWLGLIELNPIPLYLNPAQFIEKDALQIPVSLIQKKNIPLDPQPPVVDYFNVGNFTPVSMKDFSFSTKVRNDYNHGAAACEFINVTLFTDNLPVIIRLSAKGCVSDLALLNGSYVVSGKNFDLSGFGTDLSKWVTVGCRSSSGKFQCYINNKLVYQSALPANDQKVLGIGYRFQGTGSVKEIRLKAGHKMIFQCY